MSIARNVAVDARAARGGGLSVSWRVLQLTLALPFGLACESDSLKPLPVDPTQVYWSLEVSPRAAMLSTMVPYNTLALVATARNPQGDPISGGSSPVYVSRDVDQVIVTPDGLRAVKAKASPTWVVVSLTIGNVTHADSVQVKVVQTPIGLASFSAHPVPPDTAKDFADALIPRPLLVIALDSSGNAITGLPISFTSSDKTIATIDRVTGAIKGRRPGLVTFYASTSAFGVVKVDTVPYKIGQPLSSSMLIQRIIPAGGGNPFTTVVPSEIRVAVGAIVQWGYQQFGEAGGDTTSIDIVFDDEDLANVVSVAPYKMTLGQRMIPPVSFSCDGLSGFILPTATDCQLGGNIEGAEMIRPPLSINALRVFTAPGVYDFHSVRRGFSGRVIVLAEE